MKSQKIKLLAALSVMFFLSAIVAAQATAFNYQGHLNNGGTAANGNYDFEFALYDALTGGTQLGSTIALSTVAVTNDLGPTGRAESPARGPHSVARRAAGGTGDRMFDRRDRQYVRHADARHPRADADAAHLRPARRESGDRVER